MLGCPYTRDEGKWEAQFQVHLFLTSTLDGAQASADFLKEKAPFSVE
jgi:hypothetical protein